MKKFYKTFLLVLFISFANKEFAQSKESKEPTKLFRLYEDEDFLNITGNGKDKSYSNGTRLDLFYQKKNKNRFFLDRLMPKAGDSSNNVYGWGLMQIMVTPGDLTVSEYQPRDYPYSGALFATHTLYSYNPQKKYSFQTEILAGVRGPASFAEQVQTGFHSLINYQKPMGWDNQLRNTPIININFTAEKQFLSVGNFMEINGGTLIAAGSFADAVFVYPMIRIGKMSPYFNGYFSQFGAFERNGRREKTQYYFVFTPVASYAAYNSMIQGKRENEDDIPHNFNTDKPGLKHFVTDIRLGAVIAHGNLSLSYTQTYTSEYKKDLYSHSVGNLSLYVRW
jgi:lipid A 3-O-deacylase